MLIVRLVDGTEVSVDSPTTRAGFRTALVSSHPQLLMMSGRLKDGTSVDFNVTSVVIATEKPNW